MLGEGLGSGYKLPPPVEYDVVLVDCRVAERRAAELVHVQLRAASDRRLVGQVALAKVAALLRRACWPQPLAQLLCELRREAPVRQPERSRAEVGQQKVLVPDHVVAHHEHVLVHLARAQLEHALDREVLARHLMQLAAHGIVAAALWLVKPVQQRTDLRVPRVDVDVELEASPAVSQDYPVPDGAVDKARKTSERGMRLDVPAGTPARPRLIHRPRRLPAGQSTVQGQSDRHASEPVHGHGRQRDGPKFGIILYRTVVYGKPVRMHTSGTPP